LRNLEVKALDPDPEATARACVELGAVDHGVLEQRDTYFRVETGRLKLREEGGAAELVFYERPEAAGVRESRYERVPADPALGQVLALALGPVGVVDKRRRLFLHRGVRIHLDEVAGLGTFVELEAVLPEATEEALGEVMGALGFDERETIAGGYLELVLRRPVDG
jgi:adenylate cyclase class 2